MNLEFASTILQRVGKVDPPGCCSSLLPHPAGINEAVEIGFAIEHRYAFHYWIKCKTKHLHGYRSSGSDEAEFQPPDLITWDWHDDTGGPCDFIVSELEQLDQTDEQEVALFCWAGLRQLNDGHIAPAIWLNAIGNVYVLQKQRDDYGCERNSRSQEDRYGQLHRIEFFRSAQELSERFAETKGGSGVIWDVDMDFFTEEESVDDQCYTPMMSRDSIRAMLSPEKPWMPAILGDLRSVTIALEPKYTGGLSRSLEIFNAWESALFKAPIFDKNCEWKPELR